uniref:Integrin subunit alpha 4 n=1 Tax=Takifugu rubripes TaxID=31033 RepID=A0A674N107_TAKRU
MRSCRNRALKTVSYLVSIDDLVTLSRVFLSILHPSLGTMYVGCGLILAQLLLLIHPAAGYNLDQEHSLVFSGPPSSMFGYSVLLHQHRAQSWLVVGAPVANSSSSPLVDSPGAIYSCDISAEHRRYVEKCGKTCKADSDHQWLGVSLSRQPGDNGGHVLACAHRWKNIFYSQTDSQTHKLPNGVCYRYGNDLRHAQPIIPCYRDYQKKFGEDYGSCQAGISNFLTRDLIIMGAPGTSYWTGSVLVFNTSSGGMSVYLDDETGAVSFGSYLGYSVGAGHFLSPDSVEVVGGAPQYYQKGKVFIFTIDKSFLRIVSEVSGQELGSYFGSSVCAIDLNADGLSDLLVGAPMATGATREEGRVHVYINQGQGKLAEAAFQLTGSDAYAARFGETVADLGDLDDDGYPDVAIGAPHEENLNGAVYIYNGRKEGISAAPSQRITGSTLGHRLQMFGQSLTSGVDIDHNGYQDVAVGAFLSDSAVVLRTRPVVQVKVSLVLPEQIDQQMATCREQDAPTVCFNVSICFSVRSRQFRGAIDLQYNLTADPLHKPSFPHRFYFHYNGSSNSTRGWVRARPGQITCLTHVAHQKKDVRDIFTPVEFEVSYSHSETSPHRGNANAFPPLKPILQQSPGHQNRITNQTQFARSCSLVNCSTNMQLSAELMLPHQQPYFALGSGNTIVLKTALRNAGDDAFLPRLSLRFPSNIHYNKVLQNVRSHSSDWAARANSHFLNLYLVNISFLLDVNQNSTPGDIILHLNASSDNLENEEYLHDNSISLTLPLKYGVNVNVHGFVTPNSFVFGDEEATSVECYTESFNYTYKVLNSGPSRSRDTVVVIMLPKILTPYRHRLLQLVDWQVRRCLVAFMLSPIIDDCDVPQASVIKRLIFFFSSVSTRRMFCGRGDEMCEQLVCHLGNLEVGREASIHLEVKLNPNVLLQAPGRHGIMKIESTAVMSNPKADPHTILIHGQPLTEPSALVKIFIIVVSLILGLVILAALVWCLWKAGFFKRNLQKKKEEEFNRDSWDYVPKSNERESTS